jgi:phage portal protein BeeE
MFNPLAFPAEQSQLVEQLKLSAEQVAMTLHIPAYMIGAAPPPTNNNVPALTQQYYQQCLQKFFTAIEDLLDDGLGLTYAKFRSEFDLEELMRMDAAAQTEMLHKASGGAYMKPDEARAKAGMLPVPGGNALYKQHQDYSLDALAKRDAKDDPFESGKTAPAANDDEVEAATDKALYLLNRKSPEALCST